MASVRMSARELADRYKNLIPVVRRNLIGAVRESAKEAKQEAIRFSSGTASKADLRRAGHPFARRRPQAVAFPPFLINKHRPNGFAMKWRSSLPMVRGNRITARVFNISEVAKYMDGTKYMIPRPVADAVLAIVLPAHEQRIQKAYEDAYQEVMTR